MQTAVQDRGESVLNQVLREEKKFLIHVEDFLRLSHRLGAVMLQDPHNGTHGYVIRSLYYDTIGDRDYYEKDAGVEERRKIRLRIYDPENDFAMLEMKQKQGAQQRKRSLRVSRADALLLARGDYTPLLHYAEPFAAECFGLLHCRCYRPVTIVEYHRKAFIARENKIRITFDNQIAATESCFDLFSPRLNMNPVLDRFDVVLEVKFNGFLLGYLRALLGDVDKSELSVSKYVLARQTACRTQL